MDPRPGRKADQLIDALSLSTMLEKIETASSDEASG